MSVAIRNLKFTILFVSINTFLILLINTIINIGYEFGSNKMV